MKKSLNAEGITNELKGGSAFFPGYKKQDASLSQEQQPEVASQPTPPTEPKKETKSIQVINKDNMLASKKASMIANNQDLIENIRKSVKRVGKEVSFVRLTPEEKKQLVDIAYTYKSQGIKTSENEISRIGINYMLEDYQANREESILAKVLEALNA